MRICLYTETALPKMGGQEMVVDALARQFLALGHEPIVLAPRPRKLSIDDASLPYPVVRHPRFISTRRFVAWYAHWLLRLHRTRGFDVLHCHSVYPCGYLAALCRERLGVPTVITSHGGDVREGNVRLAKPGLPARHTLGIRSADALVSISRFTREGFLRLCPQASDNIVAIPNGVDLAPLATAALRPDTLSRAVREHEYVLFLGRLHHRKGVDVLLDAFADRAVPAETRLVVAGDGEERPALVAQAARLGLAQRVHFVGPASGDAKTWLLQNCRFVVIPTRTWEAFPLVVLESYAAGRPVIGTAIAGLSDVVFPGQTGLTVAACSAAELAGAIAGLWTEPTLAARYGENARRLAQDYSWTRIALRHLELYESLRRATRPRRAA